MTLELSEVKEKEREAYARLAMVAKKCKKKLMLEEVRRSLTIRREEDLQFNNNRW